MRKPLLLTIAFVTLCWAHTKNQNGEFVEDEDENSKDSHSLSDIAAVSKFITDFYRIFEKNSVSNYPELSSSQVRTVEQVGTKKGKVGDPKNTTYLVKCSEDRRHGSLSVELVNSTRLVTLLTPDVNVTSRNKEAECLVLLFYSRTCPFSCAAAPHFNALPRAFPSIKMAAFNAMQFQSFSSLFVHSFNTQFGIAGVPTVILFHNGRPAAKFNDSEYTLDMFSRFITRYTGTKPVHKMFVTSGDFGGPVPSVLTKEPDYLLVMAWCVILVAMAMWVSRSRVWNNLVETIQNTWRESQATHEHSY